jgi:hypothetical protein
MISYSRASKLDELKNNNTYDWSAADPVAPRTLMFVAQLVPAAPHREGVRKEHLAPSQDDGSVSQWSVRSHGHGYSVSL